MYKYFIKFLIDFILSIMLISILSPIFFFVTLLLFFANRGRVFFTQSRPGKHAKPFKVIKFKTMNDKLDSSGNLLPDAKRLTPIGCYIRKTSLDELPQLINVIKGDMSLIGPRPLLEEYLPQYDEIQKRRHEVRPGITGWAQINGRNSISWNQKFLFDVYYVDNVSFLFDLRIILLTFQKVIKRENVNQKGNLTVEKFNRNN